MGHARRHRGRNDLRRMAIRTRDAAYGSDTLRACARQDKPGACRAIRLRCVGSPGVFLVRSPSAGRCAPSNVVWLSAGPLSLVAAELALARDPGPLAYRHPALWTQAH